jgi:hypothetical protein
MRLVRTLPVFLAISMVSQDLPIRAVTAQEIAHSKLHDQGFEKSSKITDSITVTPQPSRPGPGAGPDYQTFMRDQVCGADLAFQGTVRSSHGMLNASETFVFTDHLIEPEIVFWSKTEAPKGSVTVTRIGGTIVLDGKKIFAFIANAPSLVNAGRYVLFVDRVPGFPSYQIRPQLGVIEDEGRQVKITPLGRWSPDSFFTQQRTFAEIQTDIRSAVARCR